MVLYYDYLLTLSREVEYFWPHQNRVGWAASSFLFNRYVSVLGHIPVLIALVLGHRKFAGVGVSLHCPRSYVDGGRLF